MKRHRSGEAAEALDRGDSAKRHRSGEAAEEIDRGDSAKRWIFSAPIDLAVFGGTALVSLALLFCGPRSGTAAPEWSWIVGVLFVDVAHVWSTSFVVYLDPAEWQRRPVFYAAVPIGCFLGGIALYACGAQVFWRVIAYLAVFHFIRQQYGWVMMYRARCEERDRIGRWLDGATIYLATIYPVMHAGASFTVNILDSRQESLSRRFAEGLDNRFDGVPWHRTDDQVILDGTLAHLSCDQWAEIPAGDHTIFVGRVTSGATSANGTPLVHYLGEYGSFR